MEQDTSKEMNEAVTQKMLAEYAQAQSVGQHSDSVFHEVAAIAWGANTLLLGFILEVGCESSNQRLVIVAGFIGLLISGYVPFVQYLIKIGQKIGYSLCREIESDLQLPHSLHTRIEKAYLKGWGQRAVWTITIAFIVAWLFVIGNATCCLVHSKTVPGALPGTPFV
jgi:hypothetical protein